MEANIGVRIYRIKFHQKHKSTALPMSGGKVDILDYLTQIVKSRSIITNNQDMQRTWFFEQVKNKNPRIIEGLVHYGTYGFESKIIDIKDKKVNYLKKETDLEQIPLYFRFWVPSDQDFGLFAMQSFRGKSCINLIVGDIYSDFRARNDDLALTFLKLAPNDIKSSKYYNSPVKEITLIKKSFPADKADKYLHGGDISEIDYEVTLKARRRGILGRLRDYLPNKDIEQKSMLSFGGEQFDETKAVIKIGNKRRRVGIFGVNSDAGVIDLTDSVKLVAGQPDFLSISSEVTELMNDFSDTLSKKV